MVSLKYEYCEIVMMSQWKIEFLVTVLQVSNRKTAEFRVTTGKTS